MDLLGEALEQGAGLGKTMVQQSTQAANQVVHLAWDQLLGTNTVSDSQSNVAEQKSSPTTGSNTDTEQLVAKRKKQVNRLRVQQNLEAEVEQLRRRKQQTRVAELQQEARGKQVKKLQEIEIKKREWEISQADKSSQGTAESRVLVG